MIICLSDPPKFRQPKILGRKRKGIFGFGQNNFDRPKSLTLIINNMFN